MNSLPEGANLFTPLKLRGLTLLNRIGVSPMCQYSCTDGFATDWHLVHLGSRAIGGAALVMAEASAVEDRGRISPGDLGIWKDEHVEPLRRVAAFIKAQGAAPGIQLAHAGRKASSRVPWEGGLTISEQDGGWATVAPSPVPFRADDPAPIELTTTDIRAITARFCEAALRALDAGFEVLEIHAAHGYLFHQFLSPLSNRRTDEYGGPFENRARFLLETVRQVRRAWPEHLPLFVRISAIDWIPEGWRIEDSVRLAICLRDLGVDLIDCSSGGASPQAKVEAGPGYQVPFAARIRRDALVPTAAVGMITQPEQADSIISSGEADMVLLARGFLRDPYWPLHAAAKLQLEPQPPIQYKRAF